MSDVIRTTPFTAFIHGESKVGKSWLGDSAPKPLLYLDAEGRARFTPSGPKVQWDPRRDAPPAADGTWETCVVRVDDPDVLQLAYQWLQSRQHPFVSVTLDSFMEVQMRFQDKIAGVEQLKQDQWGELKRRLESMLRSYRDLTNDPGNPLNVAVFLCGSENDNGTMRPLLAGSAQKTLPYIFDACGYLFTVPREDGTLSRRLLLQPTPGFVAGDNTDRLPPVLELGERGAEPNVETMVRLVAGGELPSTGGQE